MTVDGHPEGKSVPQGARAYRAPRGRDRVRARRGARYARPDGRRGRDGARRAGGCGRGRAQDRPGPDHGIVRGPDALRGVRPRPARHDRLGRPPHDVGARRRRPRHPRARPRVDRLPLHRPGGGAPAGRRARGRPPPGADAGVPTRRDRATLRGSLLTMPQIGYAHRPVALGRQGMVAAAHPLATLAGIETLRSGGTAADAAVAVNGVLAVTQPNLCGLGGDLFCLYYEAATRRVHFLNGSGRSGSRASVDELARRGLPRLPVIGPPTVSVPGCVRAWAMLLERFGTRPLGELLGPAINAADGFPISALVSQAIREYTSVTPDAEWQRVFARAGRAPALGGLFTRRELRRMRSASAAVRLSRPSNAVASRAFPL